MITSIPIYNNLNNFGKATEKKTLIKLPPPIPIQTKLLPRFPRPYLAASKTQVTFKGLETISHIVKKVKGKEFQGANLFTPNGKWYDFSKVGEKLLSQENIDITKANNEEVYAYWHANALRESKSTWTSRYNKYNMDKMLATFPTLNDVESEKEFEKNLDELWDFSRNKSLDVPITDTKGNLCLDCVILDFETTGTRNVNTKSTAPLDKIVQVGAIQIKNGKKVPETGISQLINPDMRIPEQVTQIHGINDEMVKDAPHIEEFVKPFLDNYLNKKNGIIVAYNSRFDMTFLNNAIRKYNNIAPPDDYLKEKKMHKVLDPYILIQRIHPYLGVRKKLGEQYQFLFSKKMDNAHDASADAAATFDMLKYCLLWLSKNRRDKKTPLTLREVLAFQNGANDIENINVPLDTEGCNARVNFDKSYLDAAVPVVNYLKGYKLTQKVLENIKDDIGENNYKKIIDNNVVDKLFTLKTESGLPINPAETELIPGTAKFKTPHYLLWENFQKILTIAKIEPYNGKTEEELKTLIGEKSKNYINEESVNIFVKNPDPSDIKDGNDLPDLDIARKVMRESGDFVNPSKPDPKEPPKTKPVKPSKLKFPNQNAKPKQGYPKLKSSRTNTKSQFW